MAKRVRTIDKPQRERSPKPDFQKKKPEEERRMLSGKELMKALPILLWQKSSPSVLGPAIIGFGSGYTGYEHPLGVEIVFNTPMASYQMAFAMLLSGDPETLWSVRNYLHLQQSELDPAPLLKAQIFAGMRMLDLGCGELPTFARTARRLGADVYTVDIVPSTRFKSNPEFFSEEDRKLEISRHIQFDLRKPGATEEIKARSGGAFDLITGAHLEQFDENGTPTEMLLSFISSTLAMQLVKECGYFFYADGLARSYAINSSSERFDI